MATATVSPFPMWMIVSQTALSVVGVIGNGLILIVTVLNRSLQSRCNALIAILALADLVLSIYLVQLRVYMFLGVFQIPQYFCYQTSVHGLFAQNFQAALGLVLGVDRLYAVMRPIQYPHRPIYTYMCCLLIPAFLFAGGLLAFAGVEVDGRIILACQPPSAYGDRSRIVWMGLSFAIAVAVLVVYGAAHLRIRRLQTQQLSEASVERTRRLLNSLSTVVGIYSCTWFLTICALLTTQTFARGTALGQAVEQHASWLVIINASSSFFVYSWRSADYRRAFVRLLFSFNGDSERVVSIVGVTASSPAARRRESRRATVTISAVSVHTPQETI